VIKRNNKEMIYTPKGWVLIEIHSNTPHYRIFGSWDDCVWRMNSGIKYHELDKNVYTFFGYSGSRYKCNSSSYGIKSRYNKSVLNEYVKLTRKDVYKSTGIVTVFKELPDLTNFDWK
jgi:hypothetical protein